MNKETGEKESDSWKKWKGLVLGTDNEIKKALEILKHEPKNAQEINKIISEERDKAIREMEQTRTSYW